MTGACFVCALVFNCEIGKSYIFIIAASILMHAYLNALYAVHYALHNLMKMW